MFFTRGNRFIFVVLLAPFLITQAFSQNQTHSTRSIISELRGAKLDEIAVDVPPKVASNIKALKGELRALIFETVEAQLNSDFTPKAFSAEVIRRLEELDVPVGDTFAGYGAIQSINFEIPKEYSGWLIAETELSIPYGDDISLYVFERRNDRWKHVMVVEANDYKWISEAQGFMEHRVLRTTRGTPYLITTEISPAAASVWQRLRLRILRPGSRPEIPQVVAHKDLGYCLDEDYFFSMRENGFGLIYLGGVIDQNLVGYRGVHYLDATINSDGAALRQTGTDPSNLLNQWISEPWIKASHRVRSSRLREIEIWHNRLQAENWACDPSGIVPYEHNNQLFAVSSCTRDDQSPKAYVVITPSTTGFLISSVSKERPADDLEGGETTYSDSAEGLTPPRVESSIQPKLPLGQPGPAKLPIAITVNEKGDVTSAGILNWPAERIGIAVPALQAVHQWKFTPGLFAGKPVPVSTKVEIVFQP